MRTTLNAVAERYLKAKTLSRGTRNEYFSTLRKWDLWGRGAPVEDLRRKDVREFLDCCPQWTNGFATRCPKSTGAPIHRRRRSPIWRAGKRLSSKVSRCAY
jgi:hypothetical protein